MENKVMTSIAKTTIGTLMVGCGLYVLYVVGHFLDTELWSVYILPRTFPVRDLATSICYAWLSLSLTILVGIVSWMGIYVLYHIGEDALQHFNFRKE